MLRSKPRVVIAGTGWGATSLLKTLTRTQGSKEAFDVTVASPRNHMLFTPLLASSAVGTLQFNSIAEPSKYDFPSVSYLPASVTGIDLATRRVTTLGPLEPVKVVPKHANAGVLSLWEGEKVSERPFDILCLAIGARNQTFGIEGVDEHCFFLKELSDARAIRSRVIMNVEAASRPDTPSEDRKRLLSFVIAGGGPTGCEFAAELNDWLQRDILALYPELAPDIAITIVEGKQILGSFDASLREYTSRKFARDKIRIKLGANVVKVDRHQLHLSDGSAIKSGLTVWNTGLGPRPLIASLDGQLWRKDKWGHMVTDEALRCLRASTLEFIPGVFALGDCASVLGKDYAATAQVAEQQGKFLGEQLLECFGIVPLQLPASTSQTTDQAPVIASGAASSLPSSSAPPSEAEKRLTAYRPQSFVYRHGGSLAFIGSYRAISDFTKADKLPLYGIKLKGWVSFLVWRSAYLTTLGSWRNRMRVPTDWLKTLLFGRDTTTY